jgi:hypothetical protein
MTLKISGGSEGLGVWTGMATGLSFWSALNFQLSPGGENCMLASILAYIGDFEGRMRRVAATFSAVYGSLVVAFRTVGKGSGWGSQGNGR